VSVAVCREPLVASRRKALANRWLKFNAVGAMGMVVQFACFGMLFSLLRKLAPLNQRRGQSAPQLRVKN
jgi:hypothetical protein